MIVLVIDEADARRERLIKVIRDMWRKRVSGYPALVGGGEDVEKDLAELRAHGGDVFWWPNDRIERLLEAIGGQRDKIHIVQIEDEKSAALISKSRATITITETDTEATIADLLGGMGIWDPPPSAPDVPSLEDLKPANERLYRLVKQLGSAGTEVVRQLVFQIFPEAQGLVSLGWIGEGYSSSQLIKLEFSERSGQRRHRVLKLTPEAQRQKCVDELANYPKPEDVEKFGRIVPEVFWNQSGAGGRNGPGVAEWGGWVALAYGFFGDEKHQFCDFAESYFEQGAPCFEPIRLRDRDPAEQVLDWCLSRIREEWYRRGGFQTCALWSADKRAPGPGTPWMPPYGFLDHEKGRLAKDLRKLDRYAASVLRRPQRTVDKVSQIIWEGLSFQRAELDRGIPVMVSPIHGDMNGGNLRCSVNHQQGFFIDLACFWAASHTLQDFARLEVEVKYAFMGAERDSNNHYRDLNPDHFESWRDVEDFLLDDEWTADLDVPKKFDEPPGKQLGRALRLIGFVRREAWKTQEESAKRHGRADLGAAEFVPAYRAALLYETMRAITWDALPVIKRLLAVYSAAKLAERLEES